MNVAALLAATARWAPRRDAWRYAESSATYRQTSERVAQLAAGLRAKGLVPGDRVMLVLPNGPELFEYLWATLWAGLVVVPLNWHLHPREIAYVAEHSEAAAVVASPETHDLVKTIEAAAVVRTDTDEVAQVAAGQAMSVEPRRSGDPAWLFYTSGTTGKPKGATLSHRSLMSMTLNYYSDVDQVADDAVYLHAAPLTHGSGLYLLPAVGHGATNVISAAPRFDPEDYLALAEVHGVTHGAFVAPTMLRRLADAAERRTRLPLLRSIVVGGAPLYEQDLRHAQDVFGPIITQIYGQGEAPMTIAVMSPDSLPDDQLSPAWRSCGRPFTGVDVVILDESGAFSPIDTKGEICVSGDVVMTGYWSDAPATAETLAGGWLHTGDVGYIDPAGYLYITDRVKDVIITGGSNVYPREVEEVLLMHPGVREVGVVGVPDAEWGESVRAFVVLRSGANPTPAELIEHTRAHLASFKKPRDIVFVSDLPQNSTGKVLKRQLLQPVPIRDDGAGDGGGRPL